MKEQITEKDLFDFVFYPEVLPKDKFLFLKNSDNFSQEIAFLQQLKLSIESELSSEEKELISNKIPAYNKNSIITLNKINDITPCKDGTYRLSAASELELKPKVTIKTFINDSKNYMVKILESELNTKIFVFSTKNETVTKFKLLVEPNDLEFYFEDNSKPLVLNGKLHIESIKLLL